jgi:hypothetical protein
MRPSLILFLFLSSDTMENGQEIIKEETEDFKIEHHPETPEDCEVFIKEKIEELDYLSENSDESNRDVCGAFVREIREEVKEETGSLTENPVSKTKEECQVFINEERQVFINEERQVFINEERQVFINEERQEVVISPQRAALPCSEEDPLVR